MAAWGHSNSRDNQMDEKETTHPVMVTGATGFVAGWIVKDLIEAGFTVHAPIRKASDSEKTKYLRQLAEIGPGTIKFFEADLLTPGSYREAMTGCQIVFHTASPFVVDVKDPLRDLVDPALLGTRNVLEEATRHSTVKRVVLTSSCAAMYGDAADVAEAPNKTLTEDLWNSSSSLQHNPYSYSKTVAEREAWRIAQGQKVWDLVSINPSLVIGPGINPYATSESFRMVKQMGDGTLRWGAPRWGLGAVDVRDLAKAHLSAAFTPTASGRYIISGHDTDLLGLARTLLPKYGDAYPIPSRALPKWFMWLAGPLAGGGITRKIVARNVGYNFRCDNSRSRQELAVKYRPLSESMNDMFQQMIDYDLMRPGRT